MQALRPQPGRSANGLEALAFDEHVQWLTVPRAIPACEIVSCPMRAKHRNHRRCTRQNTYHQPRGVNGICDRSTSTCWSFDTLMAERNVTRAAARNGLRQPAVSKALNRLRWLFDDPLFVLRDRATEPTARRNARIGADAANALSATGAEYQRLLQGMRDAIAGKALGQSRAEQARRAATLGVDALRSETTSSGGEGTLDRAALTPRRIEGKRVDPNTLWSP
jgi:Bacterial regulatory helix-turn-helix protein, lysR family